MNNHGDCIFIEQVQECTIAERLREQWVKKKIIGKNSKKCFQVIASFMSDIVYHQAVHALEESEAVQKVLDYFLSLPLCRNRKTSIVIVFHSSIKEETQRVVRQIWRESTSNNSV